MAVKIVSFFSLFVVLLLLLLVLVALPELRSPWYSCLGNIPLGCLSRMGCLLVRVLYVGLVVAPMADHSVHRPSWVKEPTYVAYVGR